MDGTNSEKEIYLLLNRLQQLARNNVSKEVDYGVSLSFFNSLVRSEMYKLLEQYTLNHFNPNSDG